MSSELTEVNKHIILISRHVIVYPNIIYSMHRILSIFMTVRAQICIKGKTVRHRWQTADIQAKFYKHFFLLLLESETNNVFYLGNKDGI